MVLLILREEFICAVVLSFLLFYYSNNKVKDKEQLFPCLAILALFHVLLEAATVITVNHPFVIPGYMNRLAHIGFYLTGVLFGIQFLNYIVRMNRRTPPTRTSKIFRRAGQGLLIAFVILLFVLPVEYVEGRGTNYGYGFIYFAGYSLSLLYCTTSLVLLITRKNELNRRARIALLPIMSIMYCVLIAQIIIPELLMSGGNFTLICVGLFVSLDNPDKDFIQQALWDAPSGLKNRNCYNRDLAQYTAQKSSNRIGLLVADLNYLKNVNDNYGHAEGDKLISAAAKAMREHLKSAKNIYRVGGDEFTAVYLNPNDRIVAEEIKRVQCACAGTSGFAVPLSIAMGYASGPLREDVTAIFQEADQLMYDHKLRIKRENPHISSAR